MKRIVELGTLCRNRVFTFNGKRFKVSENLGPAGVAVVPQTTRQVRIAGREIEMRETREQVWSAAAEVEIEVRGQS